MDLAGDVIAAGLYQLLIGRTVQGGVANKLYSGINFKKGNVKTRHFLGKGKNKTLLVESPDTQTVVQKMELTNLCELTLIFNIYFSFCTILT